MEKGQKEKRALWIYHDYDFCSLFEQEKEEKEEQEEQEENEEKEMKKKEFFVVSTTFLFEHHLPRHCLFHSPFPDKTKPMLISPSSD